MSALSWIWLITIIGALVAGGLAIGSRSLRAEALLIAGLLFAVAGLLGILTIGLLFLMASAGCFVWRGRLNREPAT